MARTGQNRRASFVVRAVQDAHGKVSGIVERVATGAKEAFAGSAAIGPVIARMLHETGEPASPPDGARVPAARQSL